MAECLSVGVLVADHICEPIDHMPVPGECILTNRLQLSIGGCASNAAMDLARVGVEVEVVGCVGDDPFGRFIIETLDGRGVGTRLIRRLPDVDTSASLIINERDRDRRFVHAVGANARLCAADIPWDDLRRTKVLYVGGFLLAGGLLGRELAEVFAEARRAGVTTVLDVVVPGAGDHWAQLEPLLPHTDVFLPNDDEGRAILGIDDPRRQAERYAAAGAKTVVVTCGGKGTYLLTPDLRLHAGVFPVTFVGGTGAGDAFDAGYIAGLLAGLGPQECVAWGSVLGASCVRAISATDSVFTRDEAEAFLREHRLKFEPF
jgi:sugar/nucleoside kinase (ribokinase family)